MLGRAAFGVAVRRVKRATRTVRGSSRRRASIVMAVAVPMFACLAANARAQQVAGVNDHLLRGDLYPLRDQRLQAAAAVGAKVDRIDLRWHQLEPNAEGQYDAAYVAEIDSVVSDANSLGIKPMFVVLGTPCWASSAPDTVKNGCTDPSAGDAYPPAQDSYYAHTMAFLAERYGTRVEGWELWNEPNLSYFWVSTDPTGDYANLVKATYPAIKQVSPSVPVLAGAVSLSDYDFIGKLYADGIKGYFDALSIHPYSFNDSPLTPGSLSFYGGPPSSYIDGVPAVRQVMLQYGDTRPIWFTELGWPTGTGGVSPDTQTTYVSQAFTQMETWPYVDGALYYELQDEGTDPTDPSQNAYGLLAADGTQKPAAAVFKQLAIAFASDSSASSPPDGAPASSGPSASTPAGSAQSPSAPAGSTPPVGTASSTPIVGAPRAAATSARSSRPRHRPRKPRKPARRRYHRRARHPKKRRLRPAAPLTVVAHVFEQEAPLLRQIL
jgi:hypothetical protein